MRQGVAAQQVGDTSHAGMLQAKATYEQLLAEQDYKRITAPFDGIVTVRYIDPGALVPYATSSTAAAALRFCKSRTAVLLRVYANVPQSLALFVKNGQRAEIGTSAPASSSRAR